ncbi:MAG: diguanylate cyclase [Candidatus Limnocylindrales bacterium]
MVATNVDRAPVPNGAPGAIFEDVIADDVLVFARSPRGFLLLGGTGRGAGWAEIVELSAEDEPLIDRAWRTGLPIRTVSDELVHVAGPYWARHSAVVPVGHEHLVIFGSTTPIDVSDAVIVRVAAQSVARTGGVTAEKLLGDELELVHAVRALMAYRAENVRDTARHIAMVAARALSCDVGVVQVASGGAEALEVFHLVDAGEGSETAGPDAAAYLRSASRLGQLRVDQTVTADPRLWHADVVSRLTVPIGADHALGAFALGHSVDRPRGFTLLCQRIARALAESAELLLAQAITREALAAERDVLHRVSRTDALTGVANRTGWDQAVAALGAASTAAPVYAVVSVDLDELKEVNDRYGHAAGDDILRAAASLLRSVVRDSDTVARIGGDEFVILLPDTGAAGTLRIVRRIQQNICRWRITEHGLTPELSIGWAVSASDGVDAAIRRADQRMYLAKRRRAQAAGGSTEPSQAALDRRSPELREA